jgi:hypothetical protein
VCVCVCVCGGGGGVPTSGPARNWLNLPRLVVNTPLNLPSILYNCTVETKPDVSPEIVNTSQGYIHKYENLKRKLYESCVRLYSRHFIPL